MSFVTTTATAVDSVLRFAFAVASSIGKAGGLQIQTGGIGSFSEDDAETEFGEVADEQPAFGALGVISNPLPPETIAGLDYAAEVVCAVTSDGLVPIGWRDLRLEKAFPGGIKQGSTSLAGYGGGFITLDLTAADSGSKKANIVVAYCPYQFGGDGTAAKAHSIILDPTPGNESVTITHGDGFQFAIDSEGFKFFTPDSQTWAQFKQGAFFLQADSIMLKGNVAVGSQPEAGLPLLAGAASPPCPSLWVSPV